MLEALRHHNPSLPAVIDASTSSTMNYGELCAQVESFAKRLMSLPGRPLVFLYANNSMDSIVAYLSCLTARVPVALLEATKSGCDTALLQQYGMPHLILPPEMSAPGGYQQAIEIRGSEFQFAQAESNGEYRHRIHHDLCLLLQTSGSTGNPKFVRLTERNVIENARSIISYLGIDSTHRSMQSLPMNYSYGLSLVNSHLFAGAAIVLSAHSFLRPEFWEDFDMQECTSFAGVPFMYETLEKIRFDPSAHSSLKFMTQAGGALKPEIAKNFCQKTSECGVRFFVMYGQTEATARIAFIPPEKLRDKVGSIGVAIPGGRMELAAVDGAEGVRELIYYGPNVMMGYAEGVACLALGDILKGRLPTGDIARVDDEGYFYIEGRLKRFAKLFGLRIQLEDIEKKLEASLPVRAAAIDGNDSILVFLESESQIDVAKVRGALANWLQLPPKAFFVQQIPALPRNSAGKKDYRRLIPS